MPVLSHYVFPPNFSSAFKSQARHPLLQEAALTSPGWIKHLCSRLPHQPLQISQSTNHITVIWVALSIPALVCKLCKARATFHFCLYSRARTIWDTKWTLMKACAMNEWINAPTHACMNSNEKKFHHFHSTSASCNLEQWFSDFFLG